MNYLTDYADCTPSMQQMYNLSTTLCCHQYVNKGHIVVNIFLNLSHATMPNKIHFGKALMRKRGRPQQQAKHLYSFGT